MGEIYIIKNDINNKVYIGKTVYTHQERFKQHLSDSKKHVDRHLYNAMNSYGVEHFWSEKLEECENSLLNEREIYWIKEFDSLNNGYNMTVGGDGGSFYDIDNKEVFKLWDEGKSIIDIANYYDCPITAIRTRLSNYDSYSTKESLRRCSNKPVYMYDIFGMYMMSFRTISDAEEYFGNKSNAYNIGSAAIGHQDTAYGYVWRYDKVEHGEDIYLKEFLEMPIAQFDKNGNSIRYYNSICEAERHMKELGYNHVHIGEVCRRKPNYRTAAGYVWRYYWDPFDESKEKHPLQELANLLDDQ